MINGTAYYRKLRQLRRPLMIIGFVWVALPFAIWWVALAISAMRTLGGLR